jgi:hypothetical protein
MEFSKCSFRKFSQVEAPLTMAGQTILAVLALLKIVLGGSQLAGPHLGKHTIKESKVFGNFDRC